MENTETKKQEYFDLIKNDWKTIDNYITENGLSLPQRVLLDIGHRNYKNIDGKELVGANKEIYDMLQNCAETYNAWDI